ncbi:hypothetical protein HNP32_001869 [Brevundimonas bullata]|uniref:Cryptochrome/photolyase family protein n=1 Tax=Brevundimonas bullata TaxID=13160 RepID=A0A7W7N370_9CAUL|nr:hypothetical protein [Brevundimonas bullata]MBB4798125.1 hypothetical protein [Brevundimonas bullata]MBB6383561.1 hypothetical protein [Brevundimonas bullata]
MACVADVVSATRANAYAHHIQRLMVTGNLAMMLGVHPDAVDDWYMTVYADAYEWVEMPNTRGMATFADGGIVGSKPYAASGAYIQRMSDYCGACRYDVKGKSGDGACPFNRLGLSGTQSPAPSPQRPPGHALSHAGRLWRRETRRLAGRGGSHAAGPRRRVAQRRGRRSRPISALSRQGVRRAASRADPGQRLIEG